MSCSTTTRVLPNGWLALSNGSGNLTITPARPNQTVDLSVLASGLIVLSRVRRRPGDILRITATFPVTVGLVLDFKNGATTGESLLPEEKFPGQVYTTDGEQLSGSFRFVYTGSAWKYLDSQIPA